MIKKILLGTMVAASLGIASAPAVEARDIYVQVAPPAPRVEVVPAPRKGYLWTPGYWDYRGNRHVWVNGSYVRERRGYHYAAPGWHERDGRWVLNRGSWNRGDRDHDGVPNRADSNPDNPRRH